MATTKLTPNEIEGIHGIDSETLLTAEVRQDIATGNLIAARDKIDVATGGTLTPQAINEIITGSLITSEVKKDIETGDLISAQSKVDIATGGVLSAEAIKDIITGSLLSAKPKQDLVTGSLLAANPLPSTSDFPLNYARIGYENILLDGSVSVNNDPEGALNLLSPATYDKWRPTVLSPVAVITSGTESVCNYVGIAAHNLKDKQLTVSVGDGGGLTTVYFDAPSDNGALFIRFGDLVCDRIRIQFDNDDQDAEIGVVFLGKELEMMRPNVYSGHKPVTLSATDKMTPQMSDSGQFLGKQIVRKGYSTKAGFKHLKNDWYMDNFQPFVEHAKTRPYFWAWNLAEHPDQIVYGWTNENISPSLMGIRDWFEVEFNIMAHA